MSVTLPDDLMVKEVGSPHKLKAVRTVSVARRTVGAIAELEACRHLQFKSWKATHLRRTRRACADYGGGVPSTPWYSKNVQSHWVYRAEARPQQ